MAIPLPYKWGGLLVTIIMNYLFSQMRDRFKEIYGGTVTQLTDEDIIRFLPLMRSDLPAMEAEIVKGLELPLHELFYHLAEYLGMEGYIFPSKEDLNHYFISEETPNFHGKELLENLEDTIGDKNRLIMSRHFLKALFDYLIKVETIIQESYVVSFMSYQVADEIERRLGNAKLLKEIALESKGYRQTVLAIIDEQVQKIEKKHNKHLDSNEEYVQSLLDRVQVVEQKIRVVLERGELDDSKPVYAAPNK